MAATNVNLQEMVGAKRFRADLFYRLNVFPIRIPPYVNDRGHSATGDALRPRLCPADAPHDHMHPPAAMAALVRYSWPGNIRELQNLIERAVVLYSGEVLQIPVSEIDDVSKGGRQNRHSKRPRGPTSWQR